MKPHYNSRSPRQCSEYHQIISLISALDRAPEYSRRQLPIRPAQQHSAPRSKPLEIILTVLAATAPLIYHNISQNNKMTVIFDILGVVMNFVALVLNWEECRRGRRSSSSKGPQLVLNLVNVTLIWNIWRRNQTAYSSRGPHNHCKIYHACERQY